MIASAEPKDGSTAKPIAPPLLAWYDVHARDLPWRIPPGASQRPDPYRVWLSEIMLQQTTVSAVKPYFAAFLARWPNVESLAAAAEETVLAAWAGLGYYSRARNLVKTARIVADRGGFPDTQEGLRALPGVGDYTAAAIAAIAFGRRAVVVDANIERVAARLWAIAEPLPRAKRVVRARMEEVTPRRRAGDFAQGLMDLGATICTPRDPKCLLCPIAAWCEGRAEASRYPVKPPKKLKPQRRGCAFWIEREGPSGMQVWLVTRPGKGLLGGMRALPDDGWSAREDGCGEVPFAAQWQACGTVAHGFTHADLQLDVFRTQGDCDPPGTGTWWPVAALGDAGLPTLFAKAATLARRRES